MDEVEVVVAHSERATLRVGAVFVKIDSDQANADVEVEAMALAPSREFAGPTPDLDSECAWLVANGVLPADVVARSRRVAEVALRPRTPVFVHGDLHVSHVFVDGDEVTGVIDWSEAGRGDALFDLASLTLGHPEHLGDVVAGYGADVDLDVVRAWWSVRSLWAIRWLAEHGFDPWPEIAVLTSRQ